jgi:hypothetical protein
MRRYANVVIELASEPLNGRECAVEVAQKHVVRANLVPLSRPVPAEPVLLFSF